MRKKWLLVVAILFALWLLVIVMEKPSENSLRFAKHQNEIAQADDPFVGQWKLNASKTNFTDQMKVDSAGANRYAFEFGGGTETVLIDGTEQSGNFGTTLSVTAEGPRAWKVVRKAHGRRLLTAIWTLSEDEQTLTDDYTEFAADGSPINTKYVYRKEVAGPGFAGNWVSTSGTLNSVYVIQVRPWQGDGLSFIDSLAGETKNVRFDGKDYSRQGPNANPRATTSIRRVNEHTLEITDKMNGKISDTQQITLSPDLKSLTITVRPGGSSEPKILVFDRQ